MKLHRYLIAGLMALSMFVLTGCTAKTIVKSLVEKAYKVAVDTENFVAKANTDEFIITIKVLDTPLKLLKTTLAFIDTKVTDEKAKEAIAKAIKAIDKITEVVADITPEKVNEVKATVISSLEDVKEALKFIGQYVGAEFATVTVASETDTIKNLAGSCKDLATLLDEVK